jgi:hypothetical protein
MSNLEETSEEIFGQYVRDCLLHLYDYAFLQDHILVGWLVPQTTGANRVRVFRQLIKGSRRRKLRINEGT